MEYGKLFDAEYRFMCLVWEREPVNSTELVRLCAQRFEWKKSTTYSVIKRLAQRGVLKNEGAVVTALMKKEDVLQHESESVLEKTFDNSLPAFVTAFLRDKKLTRSEADKLREMIEEAAK